MKNLFLACVAGATLAVAGVGLAGPVYAATVTPTIYLDYSNVIATGSTIIINRLPIQKSDGTIIYKDVTIQLKTDANGLLTVSPSTPVQVLSPPVLSANFKAGIYALPSAIGAGLALTGPGVVPGNVMTKWEVNATPTKSPYCGMPAVFYVGPLTSNPYYARLKAAGITSAEYSYGIIGGGGGCTAPNNGSYAPGALVGFSQSGSLLTIATFTTYSDGKDHDLPVTSFTYRIQ